MKQKVVIFGLIGLVLIVGAYYLMTKQQTNQSGQPQMPQETDQITSTQVFQGILPCADCSGLNTSLTLNPDNTYSLSEIYQGKNDDEPFITTGTWQNETGTPQNPNQEVLALTTSNGNVSYYAWTNEFTLTSLDQDKNPIDAPFNLSLTRQN